MFLRYITPKKKHCAAAAPTSLPPDRNSGGFCAELVEGFHPSRLTDATHRNYWRGHLRWFGVCRGLRRTDRRGATGRLHPSFSGQEIPCWPCDPPGDVRRGGSAAHYFADFFFCGDDSGGERGVRAAQVGRAALCGERRGDCDHARTGAVDDGDRGDWPVGVGVRGGNRHDEGE